MIVAKQSFLFIEGDKTFRVKNQDIIVDVPAWVKKLPLYQHAVADKKIIESGKADNEIENAINTKTTSEEKQLNEEVAEIKKNKKEK